VTANLVYSLLPGNVSRAETDPIIDFRRHEQVTELPDQSDTSNALSSIWAAKVRGGLDTDSADRHR
jgi:hypothetical protein